MNCDSCGAPNPTHIFRTNVYRNPGHTFRVFCEACSDRLRVGTVAFRSARHLDTVEGQEWFKLMLLRIMKQGDRM
jgi:hypothetical protein